MRRFSASVLLLTIAFAASPQERQAFLRVHNDARAIVGVGPLQWSDKLAAHAQEWANHLAQSGKFEHRPNNRYGENLAAFTAAESPEYAARLWLGERNDYHGITVERATRVLEALKVQMKSSFELTANNSAADRRDKRAAK